MAFFYSKSTKLEDGYTAKLLAIPTAAFGRKQKFVVASVTEQEEVDLATSRPVVAVISKTSHLFRKVTDPMRTAGKVKLVKVEKGFGFIASRDGDDFFFNANYVKGTEATTGAEVEFEPARSERGPIAKNVRVKIMPA